MILMRESASITQVGGWLRALSESRLFPSRINQAASLMLENVLGEVAHGAHTDAKLEIGTTVIIDMDLLLPMRLTGFRSLLYFTS